MERFPWVAIHFVVHAARERMQTYKVLHLAQYAQQGIRAWM
jgi:hypothetical protein